MEKQNAITEFLKQQPPKVIVAIHNHYCEVSKTDAVIYPLDEVNINRFFPTAYDLVNAIQRSTHFHPASEPYFRYNDGNISTNWSIVIDYEKLADHLVDWGDAGYNYSTDITPHLVEKFKEYAYNLLNERYSQAEINTIVEKSEMDFLMDDWFDIILEEFEDVVGLCPHCRNVVFNDVKHEYIYETGRMLWECDYCEGEFLV